jgi:hypothetical protein
LERFPKSKPVLGMPRKDNAWQLNPPLQYATLFEITHFGKHGVGALGLNDQAFHSIAAIPAFWNSYVHRTTQELNWRKIELQISPAQKLQAGQKYPENLVQPVQVIWIPILIDKQVFHLGIGIAA